MVCFGNFAGKVFVKNVSVLFLLCQFSACGGQPCALSLHCGNMEKSMREFICAVSFISH